MTTLSYYCRGNPEHQALIFLHGFLGCKEDWKSMMRLLSPYYYCIAIDLPGHGKSLICEEPLDQVIRFIEELKRPCHLIGYSLGGRMALMIAERSPKLLSKKVILAGNPGLSLPEEKQQRIESDEVWAEMLENHPIEYFLEKWYAQPLFFSLRQNKKLYQTTLNKRMKQDPFALAKMLRIFSLGKQAAYRQFEKTLFLYGAHDKKFATLYHRLISNAPVVTIDNASHAMHLENPGQCTEVIKMFLGESNEYSNSSRMEVSQNL